LKHDSIHGPLKYHVRVQSASMFVAGRAVEVTRDRRENLNEPDIR